jgi:hypothetical protein
MSRQSLEAKEERMNLRHRIALGCLVSAVMLGLVAAGSPAQASPSYPANLPGFTSVALERSASVDTGPSVRAGCPIVAFGIHGTAKCNDLPGVSADWNRDGRRDEVFVIAPQRTIWHAWPRSGRWREMPHDGRADFTVDALVNRAGDRAVVVRVNRAGLWCSINPAGPASWGRWFRC